MLGALVELVQDIALMHLVLLVAPTLVMQQVTEVPVVDMAPVVLVVPPVVGQVAQHPMRAAVRGVQQVKQ
jgi:uncharacterized membrane protein YqgA involved in biofilm formation